MKNIKYKGCTILKKCTALLIAFLMIAVFPFSTVSAIEYGYVPTKYLGFYYCEEDSYYVVILRSNTSITIRADVYSWGDVAAGDPYTISFNTVPVENNFNVGFDTWSKYDAARGEYVKQTGEMVLESTYDFVTHKIKIKSRANGVYNYSIIG